MLLSVCERGADSPLSCQHAPAVDGGERAVMYDRIQGVLDQPIGEGTHVRIPWFQTPTIMDIRTRPRSVSSVTGTKGEWGPPPSCEGLVHLPTCSAGPVRGTKQLCLLYSQFATPVCCLLAGVELWECCDALDGSSSRRGVAVLSQRQAEC